jgi:hypothetical protein
MTGRRAVALRIFELQQILLSFGLRLRKDERTTKK